MRGNYEDLKTVQERKKELDIPIPVLLPKGDFNTEDQIIQQAILNNTPVTEDQKILENNKHLKQLKIQHENMEISEQRACAEGLDMGIMLEVISRKLKVLNNMYRKMDEVIKETASNS